MKPEQERVKNLLTDTVTLLCKNGLQFHKELKVQGLLGITLDENEVFLIQIDEKIGGLIDFEGTIANVPFGESGVNSAFSDSQEVHHIKQQSGISAFRGMVSKFPQRPSRPLSRFSRQAKESMQRLKKSRSSPQHSTPSSTVNHNISFQDGQFAVSELQNSDSGQPPEQLSSQTADELTNNDPAIQIKKEEDPDLIIIDQDHEGEDIKQSTRLADDRQAMLGSYVTEVSGNEANIAQNIFSEFSLLTASGSGLIDSRTGSLMRRSDNETSMNSDILPGALIRNYGSQSSSDMDMPLSLNSSAPGGSLQWDSSALSSLSTAGTSTSNVRSMNAPVS